jgi:hypothetical protein
MAKHIDYLRGIAYGERTSAADKLAAFRILSKNASDRESVIKELDIIMESGEPDKVKIKAIELMEKLRDGLAEGGGENPAAKSKDELIGEYCGKAREA